MFSQMHFFFGSVPIVHDPWQDKAGWATCPFSHSVSMLKLCFVAAEVPIPGLFLPPSQHPNHIYTAEETNKLITATATPRPH